MYHWQQWRKKLKPKVLKDFDEITKRFKNFKNIVKN